MFSFLHELSEGARRVLTPTPARADPLPAPTQPLPEGSQFTVFHVLGFQECPWFHRAACIASDIAKQPQYENAVSTRIVASPGRTEYAQSLHGLKEIVPEIANHNFCPAVISTQCYRHPGEKGQSDKDKAGLRCDQPKLVGGFTQLESLLQQKYDFKSTKCQQFALLAGSGAGACPVPPIARTK